MGLGWTIPNEADVATYPQQSEVDSIDFAILAAALNGYGVLSGCQVTAQATPDLTVAIAAGLVTNAGQQIHIAAQNVTIASPGTNNRYNLVTVNTNGTGGKTVGTQAASPVFPALSTTTVVLAAIWTPLSTPNITTAMITDKRVFISSGFSTAGKIVLDRLFD